MAHTEVSYIHGNDLEAARAWVRGLIAQLGASGLTETVVDTPTTGSWRPVEETHER